ncbi:MAG: hypothetical protein IJN63_09190 [Clostridia bacterium]|nr:hypothetical protein [Clostridia bacterium]
MEKMFLTVGNTEIEFTCHIAKIPLVNEVTIERGDREITPGGFGLFTAAAIAELGAHSALCTCLGDDRYGDMLTRFCREKGISLDSIYTDKHLPTAFLMNIVEDNGARRSAFYPGAFEAIRHSFIEEAFVSRPDCVLASLDLPVEHVAYIAEMADLQEIPLFLDASTAAVSYPFEDICRCEAFVCDEAQAYRIAHIMPDSMENCLKCAVKLASVIKTHYVVMKLKERGVYVYDGKYCSIAPNRGKASAGVPDVAEVFMAALAYTYVQSRNMEVAAKYAAVAVAAYVEKGGGITALPDSGDISAYCKENDIN